MSYMNHRAPPSQANGASNGYSNSNGSSSAVNKLGRFDFDTTPETSGDERSRSRGLGGYGGLGGQQQGGGGGYGGVHAPTRIDRQHANRRSRDYDRYGGGYGGGYDGQSSRSRSRGPPGGISGRYGGGGRGREVEEILRYISQHWSFMARDNCVPVKVALQLNDPSSLGLADQYDRFQEVHQQLQNALKVIVNEHHQGFNSSIGTFHKIQQAIHASQHRVRTLRSALVQAKGSLSTARPELRAFATSSQGYDKMLQVLADIEQLQAVPDQLDALIGEKRFLGAVAALQEALALIRKPEMEDIGALSELRLYLGNHEQSLTDILIEELHSHLYLKSPYCEERWKRRAKGEMGSTSAASDEERAMYTFLDSYDGRHPMQEDTTRNPEANTFAYIQLLVESLSRMERLDVAVDKIHERMPVEMFNVVERSHREVEQRHPLQARSRPRDAMRAALMKGPDGEQRATLDDLLTTLYAKFEAIAEGHRVLHDVTAAITKRESTLDPADATTLNRSFRELWKLLQSEIKSLLHGHLADSGAGIGGQRHQENDPSANIFKQRPRDRTKKLFKLTDTDPKSPDMATEREDLEFILKASVPGLVNTGQAQHARRDREADTSAADKSAAGHKLLVEPSVFNMGILLPPSLSFLNRLKEIVPSHGSGVVASTLTSFLDDFLINVFYPQLDETLMELCGRSINDLEAFQPDPSWSKYSSRPVFKGAVRFYEVIETVCVMLDQLPHEQSFSALVVGQMRGYYDKCYQWSKSLLQRSMSSAEGQAQFKMRLAADLATHGEVNDAVIQLLGVSAEGDQREAMVLAEKESALLINLIKDGKSLEEVDLIHDRKALAALGTLHVSMKWLTARCQALRYISPKAIDMGGSNSIDMQGHARQDQRRWTSSIATPHPSELMGKAYLPLDESTAQQFDAVVVSFTELSTLVLRTLHIDVRLHLLHGISASLRNTYALGQPYNDPDPAILDLSNSLATYDTAIETTFLPPQYSFLTQDLHVLVNNSLVSLATKLAAIDDFGLARLQLNVLVLQQALKNMQPAASLTKAADFYALGEQGCEVIISRGKKEGVYDKEDLRALLALCWRDERDGMVGDAAVWEARLMSESTASFPKRGASLRRKKT